MLLEAGVSAAALHGSDFNSAVLRPGEKQLHHLRPISPGVHGFVVERDDFLVVSVPVLRVLDGGHDVEGQRVEDRDRGEEPHAPALRGLRLIHPTKRPTTAAYPSPIAKRPSLLPSSKSRKSLLTRIR